MNEKSNPMPMMYKTIPAVAELNKVLPDVWYGVDLTKRMVN